MTVNNRDLFSSFGKLFQNRAFVMAVAQQFHFGDHGSERERAWSNGHFTGIGGCTRWFNQC